MRTRNMLWSGPVCGLVLAVGLLVGCTKANPDYCDEAADCTGGKVCNLEWKACVFPDAGVGPLDGGSDSGVALDGAPDVSLDVPLGSEAGASPVDGPAGEAGEAGGTIDVSALDAPAPDVPVVDAAGTCGDSDDCTDPHRPFCLSGLCVDCQAAGAGACGAQVCNPVSGSCVECTTNAQCAKDPAKAFCVANACTGCGAPGATGCAGRTDGKTVCATSGDADGQCVECAIDGQCGSDPAKAFCVANACTGCDTPGATGCSGRTDGKTVCATSGASTGQCVECADDDQCAQDPTKSFCVANACAGCQSAAIDACSVRSAAKPVCGTTGLCVECNTSADCSTVNKPICTSNVCGACTLDSQCVSKLGATGNPGVCMRHTNGHCATDAETVYVGTSGTATCSDGNTGSAQAPVCSAQAGVGLAKSGAKPLVVVRGTLAAGSTTISTSMPLLLVGKESATLTPAVGSDGITINAGSIYLRDLAVRGNASPATGVGINAAPTGANTVAVHLEACQIANNPGGGILLDGAGFDIENTTVTGNGPGTFGLASWGGILVNSPPAGVPATLKNVTIKDNQQVGLSCSGSITGTGVLASGNVGGVDINPTCGITPCTADGGAGCGAQ